MSHYRVKCFILFVVVIFLEFLGVAGFLRAGSEALVLPAERLGAFIVHTIEFPYTVVVRNIQGYQHVQDLELRYAESVAQLSELDSLKKENADLRALIHDTASSSAAMMIAPITSYGKPSIGIGKNKEISEGNMVFLQDTLIGIVGQVSPEQSEVLLFLRGTGIPILAKTEQGISGTVSGDGRRVILKELPVEVEVKPGERIVTVGQVGIPPGLSLGRVKTIEKKKDSPTQQAIIEQNVSFYQAQFVEVRKE